MVIQLINLSIYDIFKNYSLKYKINRDVQSTGLFGLEMREVHLKLAEKVQKIVLKEKKFVTKTSRIRMELLIYLSLVHCGS